MTQTALLLQTLQYGHHCYHEYFECDCHKRSLSITYHASTIFNACNKNTRNSHVSLYLYFFVRLTCWDASRGSHFFSNSKWYKYCIISLKCYAYSKLYISCRLKKIKVMNLGIYYFSWYYFYDNSIQYTNYISFGVFLSNPLHCGSVEYHLSTHLATSQSARRKRTYN